MTKYLVTKPWWTKLCPPQNSYAEALTNHGSFSKLIQKDKGWWGGEPIWKLELLHLVSKRMTGTYISLLITKGAIIQFVISPDHNPEAALSDHALASS